MLTTNLQAPPWPSHVSSSPSKQRYPPRLRRKRRSPKTIAQTLDPETAQPQEPLVGSGFDQGLTRQDLGEISNGSLHKQASFLEKLTDVGRRGQDYSSLAESSVADASSLASSDDENDIEESSSPQRTPSLRRSSSLDVSSSPWMQASSSPPHWSNRSTLPTFSSRSQKRKRHSWDDNGSDILSPRIFNSAKIRYGEPGTRHSVEETSPVMDQTQEIGCISRKMDQRQARRGASWWPAQSDLSVEDGTMSPTMLTKGDTPNSDMMQLEPTKGLMLNTGDGADSTHRQYSLPGFAALDVLASMACHDPPSFGELTLPPITSSLERYSPGFQQVTSKPVEVEASPPAGSTNPPPPNENEIDFPTTTDTNDFEQSLHGAEILNEPANEEDLSPSTVGVVSASSPINSSPTTQTQPIPSDVLSHDGGIVRAINSHVTELEGSSDNVPPLEKEDIHTDPDNGGSGGPSNLTSKPGKISQSKRKKAPLDDASDNTPRPTTASSRPRKGAGNAPSRKKRKVLVDDESSPPPSKSKSNVKLSDPPSTTSHPKSPPGSNYDREEVVGSIITSFAFGRATSLTAPDILENVVELSPQLLHGTTCEDKDASKAKLLNICRDILSTYPAFGKIERTGEDADGNPLEAMYHYEPQNDPDVERAANLGGLTRRKRQSTKKHVQYHYAPVSLNRWEALAEEED